MAAPATSRYLTALSVLICFSISICAKPNSTSAVKNFGKISKLESALTLYGDAKVVNGGSSVQITGFSNSSSGRVFYKKPIKLVEGNPKTIVSFSSHFTFSISPGNGDGFAFAMVPIGFPLNVFDGSSFGLLSENKIRTLAVEFGTLNGNHVGVDVKYSLVKVKVSNVSSINLVLNSGKKLQAWIDYEAGSKRLEVRLSELGEVRPVDPLLSCPIDLSRMWKGEEVFVGLSSSNRNSSQKCNVYSWSLKLTKFPHWMHSEPLDPEAFSKSTKALPVPKRRDCLLKVLVALVFGAACGALGAVFVLFVVTIIRSKPPVVPEEYPPQPVVFECEKLKVVVEMAMEDGKK